VVKSASQLEVCEAESECPQTCPTCVGNNNETLVNEEGPPPEKLLLSAGVSENLRPGTVERKPLPAIESRAAKWFQSVSKPLSISGCI
jgi:hypothetical protein